MRIPELPQKYKELAKKRIEQNNYKRHDSKEDIRFAFFWEETPEGDDWWCEVCDATSVGELPPIPFDSYSDSNAYYESDPPLNTQIGGSHYRNMNIQPIDFILGNDLGFVEGNIIKYICRYNQKNGIEDLEKIKHYVDLLIENKTKNELS